MNPILLFLFLFVLAVSCGIPPSVWQTLANEPAFEVNTVTINGPDLIPDGGFGTYSVTVELACRATGTVRVVRELWDSDLPPIDPDELLSWRRDTVLCAAPPNVTVTTETLSVHCINGTIIGDNATDPDGRANDPNSGEGTGGIPPGAELKGRAQGSTGPARFSGEKLVRCVVP
jgi:hypothetical protein